MNFEDEIFKRVEEEYLYYNGIKKLVDKVGVAFEAMPEGLLLEVRAFTGHISDAITIKNDSQEDRLDNISSAHHHLRRIELDCYKTLCVFEFNKIEEFERKYRFYNLSDVDDGNFVQNLDNLKQEAKEASEKAKSLDLNGNNSKQGQAFDELYDAYQDAFNKYCNVTKYIDDHRNGASRIAKQHLFFKIAGVAGWVVSIGVSIAFGIVSCLPK